MWSARTHMGTGRTIRCYRFPIPNSPIIFILLASLILVGTASSKEKITDPYTVFQKHYQAIGGLERLKGIRTSYSEGLTHYDGLQGKFKYWEKRPLQYRTEEDYNTIAQVEGDNGQFSWLFDTNGQLLIHKHPAVIKRREIARLLDSYEHLNKDSINFTLAYLGVATVSNKNCHEILLTNTINSDKLYFYFEVETYLLLQSVSQQPDAKIIIQYDDFRMQDNITISFHQKTKYLPWEKTEETWVLHQVNNPVIDETLFHPPATETDYQFTGTDKNTTSATIPFNFVENLIYLPVRINGDTKYWVLDSGASMSVIDVDYARSLGLKAEGSIKGYGFGDLFELSFVTVPQYQVGNIVFDSQKLYGTKDIAAKSYEPVIHGILGYDFLSRFVVEIDYDNSLVTLHRPENFVYKKEGKVIDAPLKYRTFTVPVVLDNLYDSRWSLDLGAYQSSIHYPFAEKHNLLDTPGVESVSQGLSSISREKTSQFRCLDIGGFELQTPLLNIPLTRGKGATALGEVGGNLGNSTLRRFHLWLNYPKQQLILEKGRQYDTAPARDRSGILIGKSLDDRPMVSFVARNSPAELAGIFAGDIITAFDGKSTLSDQGHVSVVSLRNRLRQPAGTKVSFSLLRDQQEIETSFLLEDLYPGPETAEGCR